MFDASRVEARRPAGGEVYLSLVSVSPWESLPHGQNISRHLKEVKLYFQTNLTRFFFIQKTKLVIQLVILIVLGTSII